MSANTLPFVAGVPGSGAYANEAPIEEQALVLERAVWKNYLGALGVRGHVAVPGTRDELYACVAYAVEKGHRIRAVGAGRSSSAVARPHELWADLSKLRRVLPHAHLRDDVEGGRFLRLEAGLTLDELNFHLASRGRALPVMCSYGGQSVVGAVATATHGSSLRYGPLSDLVVALEMVVVEQGAFGPEVRLVRLEPSQGITDRKRFDAAYARHSTTLVQDDDLFYGSVVGLGAVGIVYALTIRTEDAFHLAETRRKTNWAELAPELVELARNHAYFDVVLYPHPTKTEDEGGSRNERILCLVTSRRVVGAGRVERRDDPEQTLAPFLGRLGSRLGWLMSVMPEQGLRRLERNFDDKIALQSKRGELVGPSHVIQRTSLGDHVRAYAMELSVSLDAVVPAVNALLDNAERLLRAGFVHSAPVGLRFVGPSRHALAMTQGRASATIEVPLLDGTRRKGGARVRSVEDARTIFESVVGAVEAVAPDARPHWGMVYTQDEKTLLRRYPRAGSWVRALRRFNATGTFHNTVSETLLRAARG